MNKIAVFGKPGSGKSTLSKRLASATGIKLYPLDSIVYQSNGEMVDRRTYETEYEKILSSGSWIIDGIGPMESFYKRLDTADTLIYIDISYAFSYWFVTKRLLKGMFIKPEGWPEGSSVLKGTVQSYKTLRFCPKFWNESFMHKLEIVSNGKTLFVVQTISELNGFVGANVK